MVYIQLEKFHPAAHFLLVRVNTLKETKSGIVLPDNFKSKVTPDIVTWFPTVIKISPACDLIAAGVPDLKPGDIIGTMCPVTNCPDYEDVASPGVKYVLLSDGEIHARYGTDDLLHSERADARILCTK